MRPLPPPLPCDRILRNRYRGGLEFRRLIRDEMMQRIDAIWWTALHPHGLMCSNSRNGANTTRDTNGNAIPQESLHLGVLQTAAAPVFPRRWANRWIGVQGVAVGLNRVRVDWGRFILQL